MTLSVVVPVYNERHTIANVLDLVAAALPNVPKQIILVDDCSTDGTREWLQENFPSRRSKGFGIQLDDRGNLVLLDGANQGREEINLEVVYHERNSGKGAALRTGFAAVTGDVVVIQDADLEYDPQDWGKMYPLIAVRKVADVVYGSRFFGAPHRSLFFHHYMANRLISMIFNIFYNQMLSDIEVCYKMMRQEVLRSLRLSANDFAIEIELSSQIARSNKWRIYEVGISYFGRTYAEGKKINWKDGVKAIWCLIKYRITPL